MVGRDVLLRVEKPAHEAGDTLLEVKDLSVVDDRELPAVSDVSLSVRAGEIVGLAGVDANGQSELIEAITGLRKPEAGSVAVGGRDVTGSASARRWRPASATSPRTATAAASCSSSRWRRTSTLREYQRPGFTKLGWLSPRKMADPRQGAAARLRRARRRHARRAPPRCRAATSRSA